jgi:hypothetical protein
MDNTSFGASLASITSPSAACTSPSTRYKFFLPKIKRPAIRQSACPEHGTRSCWATHDMRRLRRCGRCSTLNQRDRSLLCFFFGARRNSILTCASSTTSPACSVLAILRILSSLLSSTSTNDSSSRCSSCTGLPGRAAGVCASVGAGSAPISPCHQLVVLYPKLDSDAPSSAILAVSERARANGSSHGAEFTLDTAEESSSTVGMASRSLCLVRPIPASGTALTLSSRFLRVSSACQWTRVDTGRNKTRLMRRGPSLPSRRHVTGRSLSGQMPFSVRNVAACLGQSSWLSLCQ